MSTTPRIIAATASAALLAGLGAGTAVLAVDTVMADGQTDAAQVTADDNLPTPQDERTTVYQEPQQYQSDDDVTTMTTTRADRSRRLPDDRVPGQQRRSDQEQHVEVIMITVSLDTWRTRLSLTVRASDRPGLERNMRHL